MNKRLLIVHTGGTIGMQPSPQGYRPCTQFKTKLLEVLEKTAALPDQWAADVLELAPLIDSANLTPQSWPPLMTLLRDHWSSYNGFVILHGTDTLAYTASALSFILGALDRPVVLTGAQVPLFHPTSDAVVNLQDALNLATSEQIYEVVICFGRRILRANRSCKVHAQAWQAFDSPNFPHLGQITTRLQLEPSLLLPAGQTKFNAPLIFSSGAVACLPFVPGLRADQLQAWLTLPQLRALVIETYGAGNFPDIDTDLVACLESASAQGMALFNITQCHQGKVIQGAYATSHRLKALGVAPGQDLTREAAITKLHVLLAQGLEGDALKQQWMRPLRGEMQTPCRNTTE